MRILFLIGSLGMGGAERQFIELLKGLSNDSTIDVRIVIFRSEIEYDDINRLGIKIDVLERRVKKDPAVFFKLYTICKSFKPDILHSWELMSTVYAIPVCRLLRIPLINGVIRDAPPKSLFAKKDMVITRLTFLFSDIILGNSRAGLSAYQAPLKKSFFIHNGFDLSRIDKEMDRSATRRKYNICSRYVVGMVGAFSARKDYNTFIRAAIRILKLRKDIIFLCIGDGAGFQDAYDSIPLDFRDSIRLPGKVKDVESIVNILDIGVLATNRDVHGEGISNAIMEYMALAKPVIATTGGGTDELVQKNKTGFLYQNKHAQDLADKILFLINNIDLAKEMGRQGQKRLKEEFNLEKMTLRYIDLYKNCCRWKNRKCFIFRDSYSSSYP